MIWLKQYQIILNLPFSNERIVLTGNGRVSSGAKEILLQMKIQQVNVDTFLNEKLDKPIFVQLKPNDYVERISDKEFNKAEYYKNPELYRNTFKRFLPHTDILINGIFYNNKAPRFFELPDLNNNNKIQVIGDITCDMMPHSSIPCTIFTSTIASPFWSFDIKQNSKSNLPFEKENITMMTIDNLPNELPRDASKSFGTMFITHVLPSLFNNDCDKILENATITKHGKLTDRFNYLQKFVQGE
jgi:saccharopine dehydrogenase (NAD+, L-lysine-forming)